MTAQTPDSPLKRKISCARAAALFATLALTPLCGCALFGKHPAPQPAVAPAPVVPAQRAAAIRPKKAPPRDTHPVDDDPPVRMASIDPQSLLGLDPDGVQKKLGAPARMKNGALSREWVYAAPGCSFSVFFYPKVNSTSFRALKYGSAKDNGATLDSSDACVRKLLTVRIDAD